MNFLDALEALNNRKTVQCVVDGGDPVIYSTASGEFTIDGNNHHFRNFAFSVSQILWGEWTVIDKEKTASVKGR